jgi:hypothetical protein
MILPSMAGYANIWCGGQEVWDSLLRITFVAGLPVVSVQDASDILFRSPACTFQGSPLCFPLPPFSFAWRWRDFH